jgi:predicted ATPase
MLQGFSNQKVPPDLVQTIYGETEGNPFFVEEVFKHLSEEGRLFDSRGQWRSDLRIGELDVPRNVQFVVGRRLERLSRECRDALLAAAVIGPRFSFELLARAGRAHPDALLDTLDEAERAHVVTSTIYSGEEHFAFAHELIRQTLLTGTSHARRQQLHQRVVEAMDEIYGDSLDEHAGALLYHLDQAGRAVDSDRVGHYLVVAGQQAASRAAVEEATGLYDRALSQLSTDAVHQRADLLYYRGEALRRMGRWKNALDDWEEALAIYETMDNPDAVARVCYAMADHLVWGEDRLEEGVQLARRGLAAIGRPVKGPRLRGLTQRVTRILRLGRHGRQ